MRILDFWILSMEWRYILLYALCFNSNRLCWYRIWKSVGDLVLVVQWRCSALFHHLPLLFWWSSASVKIHSTSSSVSGTSDIRLTAIMDQTCKQCLHGRGGTPKRWMNSMNVWQRLEWIVQYYTSWCLLQCEGGAGRQY